MTLTERLEHEIEKANFDYYEMEGFKVVTKLGILAGATIGYRLAIQDMQKEAASIIRERRQ